MSVKPVPDGFHAVTPYMIVDDVAAQIAWLEAAFNAVQIARTTTPDGRVMHAQVQIADSIIMLGPSQENWSALPSSYYMYVPDTDAVYAQALAAGGEAVMEPADQFYGDRSGGVRDPGGNYWWIATHIEDLSEEEIAERMKSARSNT